MWLQSLAIQPSRTIVRCSGGRHNAQSQARELVPLGLVPIVAYSGRGGPAKSRCRCWYGSLLPDCSLGPPRSPSHGVQHGLNSAAGFSFAGSPSATLNSPDELGWRQRLGSDPQGDTCAAPHGRPAPPASSGPKRRTKGRRASEPHSSPHRSRLLRIDLANSNHGPGSQHPFAAREVDGNTMIGGKPAGGVVNSYCL